MSGRIKNLIEIVEEENRTKAELDGIVEKLRNVNNSNFINNGNLTQYIENRLNPTFFLRRNSMTIYKVSCAEYYKGLEQNFSFTRDRDKVKKAMIQLIDKYNIKNKSVLSVGPGLGYEEYWFNENNCQLTFIDIDETKSIEPYLKTVPDGEGLTYILEDAREAIEILGKKYDICYFSGFTPDEIYRRDIQNEYYKSLQKMNFILLIIRYILLKLHLLGRSWPKYRDPFSSLVINISRNALKNGGLFILQSYYAGIDIKVNPHFVKLVKKQLSRAGISLLNIYYFKESSDVSLTVGYKGTKDQSNDYLNSIRNNPELTKFHGRSEIHSKIIKVV